MRGVAAVGSERGIVVLVSVWEVVVGRAEDPGELVDDADGQFRSDMYRWVGGKMRGVDLFFFSESCVYIRG